MERYTWDLAVIGAGIIGATAAYLARLRHPGWRIGLLDRSMVGHGATLYSVAMDFPYGSTSLHRELESRSMVLYAGMQERIPGLPFRDLPMYGICGRRMAPEVEKGLVIPLGAAPIPGTIRSLPPGSPEGFAIPGGMSAFGPLPARYATRNDMALLIARNFLASGPGECIEGAEISGATPFDGGVELETHDGRSFRSRRALFCTGPWAAAGLPGRSRDQAGIRTKKIVAMHLALACTRESPLLYLFEDEAFLLPQPENGRWIFSFRSDHWDCPTEASALRLEREDREKAQAILERYLPGVGLPGLGARIFCDGYTASRQPVMAAVPGLAGCAMAAAASGSGFRLAPAIAEKALDLIGC